MLSLAVLPGAFLVGCSSAAGTGAAPGVIISTPAGHSGYRGDRLSPPVRLSAATAVAPFQASTGATTTLGHLQKGRLLLLYFGYTSCPDVCPTTMSDLGQALRQLPSVVQAHTQVAFVTSDPAHDTLAVLKVWLGNFDQRLVLPFVGLRASLGRTDTVAKSVGVPLSPPTREPDGTISVQHGAQTLAFVNGTARVLWVAGTSVADYAHDISKLAAQTTSG